MPQRRFEQEAQLRTDDWSDIPGNQMRTAYKTDDVDNPQEIIPYGEGEEVRTVEDDVANKVFVQTSQINTSLFEPVFGEEVERVTSVGTFVKDATVTTIVSDLPDPTTALQAVTVVFTVTSGAGTPTGTVTVTDGTDEEEVDVADGTVDITLTTVGARTLVATYSGDDDFEGSVSAGRAHTVSA